MPFARAGLSPVMEKIVTEILDNNGSHIQVKQFRHDLSKMRLNKDDSNEIIKYLQEKGYIIRRGKIIIKI